MEARAASGGTRGERPKVISDVRNLIHCMRQILLGAPSDPCLTNTAASAIFVVVSRHHALMGCIAACAAAPDLLAHCDRDRGGPPTAVGAATRAETRAALHDASNQVDKCRFPASFCTNAASAQGRTGRKRKIAGLHHMQKKSDSRRPVPNDGTSLSALRRTDRYRTRQGKHMTARSREARPRELRGINIWRRLGPEDSN
jgi:hypothetical protein